MKRHLRLFLLITGCCLIHCILFGQDNLDSVYSVKFTSFKTELSKDTKATLNKVATILKNNPGYNFAIRGCSGSENRRLNQANWDRVNNIVIHLVENEGINAERLIFKYSDESENCNTINIEFTQEKLDLAPAPHPNLRRKSN
jgi:hypothetical protein